MDRRALLRTIGVGTVAGACFGPPGSAARPTDRASEADAHAYRRDGAGRDVPEIDAYEPIGRVSVDGATEAVVGDDGDVAYVAGIDGFATVDVSDPAEPTVLADERDVLADVLPDDEEVASYLEIFDVKVSGDRLAVVTPANVAGEDVFHGLLLYDVSDPTEPELVVDPYETDFHVHNCFLDGDVCYLVANGSSESPEENPLVVLDVSDDDPEELTRWSILDHEPDWEESNWLLYYLHDVYVHDDVAFLAYWNAGTYLLDVSDPSDPTYLSHVTDPTTDEADLLEEARATDPDDAEAVTALQHGLPGNDHYSAVDDTGTILAVGREAWATESGAPEGAGGIDLFDVSDPAEPTYEASIDPPETYDASYEGGRWTTAHNFEIRSGLLTASWYQGGVSIHDVSDLGDPTELARWHDPEEAGFWTARRVDDETFVASATTMIPNTDLDGALYTFPVAAGEQPDPPSLTEPSSSDDGEGSEDDGVEDAEAGSEPDDDSGTGGDDDTAGVDEADPIPGLTTVAGAAGVLGGAYALTRRNVPRGPATDPDSGGTAED